MNCNHQHNRLGAASMVLLISGVIVGECAGHAELPQHLPHVDLSPTLHIQTLNIVSTATVYTGTVPYIF